MLKQCTPCNVYGVNLHQPMNALSAILSLFRISGMAQILLLQQRMPHSSPWASFTPVKFAKYTIKTEDLNSENIFIHNFFGKKKSKLLTSDDN